MEWPTPEVAVGFWRQGGYVSLLLRGVPRERRDAVQAAVEERLASVFERSSPEDRTLVAPTVSLLARCPAL